MEENPVYIHYGDDQLKTLNPIKNRECYFTKPYGGLWASRENDKYGWKQWCESEEFRLDTFGKYFKFMLKKSAKILSLNNIDQLDYLPKLNNSDHPYIKHSTFSECCLDFEKLKQKYDAIEITDIDQFYWALYGWDCNSILVMNPDIIEVI